MPQVNWDLRRRRLAEYHEQRRAREAAWAEAVKVWERTGLQPSAFTAFKAGWEAAYDNLKKKEVKA